MQGDYGTQSDHLFRIIGPVTESQLRIVRQADKIFMDEIQAAGLYRRIAQAFASILSCKAVAVMGDQRSWEQCIVLRAVVSSDYMTATPFPFEWSFVTYVSSRIVNEVRGVSRVFFDGEYHSRDGNTQGPPLI